MLYLSDLLENIIISKEINSEKKKYIFEFSLKACFNYKLGGTELYPPINHMINHIIP